MGNKKHNFTTVGETTHGFYKEYHRYNGKLDRSDAALCTDILEVKRRKEAAAVWQASSHGLAPDAFADNVSNPEQKGLIQKSKM